MRKSAKNNKKGFTLIELIVVVAILVALMLMLVPRLTGFTDDAKKTANQANARAIYTAIVASESAKDTGMYSTEYDIKLCDTDTANNAYSKFWDSGNTSGCSVKRDAKGKIESVTYPASGDNQGTYPNGTYDPTDDKKGE